jgi:hypothetical protein
MSGLSASHTGGFWARLRERCAAWLRINHLEDGILMSALLVVDSVVGRVRSLIRGKVNNRTTKVSEYVYASEAEIDDPDVLAALKKRHRVALSLASVE